MTATVYRNHIYSKVPGTSLSVWCTGMS